MILNKQKYLQIKEINLYLFGLTFFTSFRVAKICLSLMFIFIFIDILIFKEKFELGNKKIRNFILFFIIGGTFWNFCAAFNYRAARSFLKINRYFIIVFYLYSLLKYKKVVLRNFLLSIALSYLVLFYQGIQFFIENKRNTYYRFGSFEGVMDVAVLTTVVAAFASGIIIQKNNKKRKIMGFVFLLISCFLIMITQTRASLLAFGVSIFIMLVWNRNFKILILGLSIFFISMVLFFQMPESARFKSNTFNVSITQDNMSNGLRVEMWKNAIWRFKQHPIMGSGTKQDSELFKRYVQNMPEKTKIEKIYKKTFENGFDDAHSLYLNALTDNGLFFIFQIILLFGIIPYVLIKNKNFFYGVSLIGGFTSYMVFGVAWPLWRHGWDPMFLWTLIGITIGSYNFRDENRINILEE